MEVSRPGVAGVDAPVAGEGDGRDDEFPVHAGGFGAGEEGEEGVELGAAEEGFVWGGSGEGEFRVAVAAGVEEEEGGGAVGEVVVGCVGEGGGWVDRAVIGGPGIDGCGIGVGSLLVPVVGYFVVVNDVDPGEVCGGVWPVGGGVHLAVFSSVCFDICAESVGYVYVDEIAEE